MSRPDKTPPPHRPHSGDRLVEGGRGVDVRPQVHLQPSQLPSMGPIAPVDSAPINQGGSGQGAPVAPPPEHSG